MPFKTLTHFIERKDRKGPFLHEGQFNEETNEHTGIVRIIEKGKGMYEGQLQNGEYWGFGRQIFQHGHYYIGWFVNGQKQGYGRHVMNDGRVTEGMWNENRINNQLAIDQT